MIDAQANKVQIVVAPSTGLGTATSTAVAIDASDAGYLFIQVLGTRATAAGTNKLDALAIASGPAATGPWTNVSGLVGTTNTTAASGEFVIPAHSVTNVDPIINLGLKPTANFYRLSIKCNSTTYDDYVVLANTSERGQTANTVAEAGSILNVYI